LGKILIIIGNTICLCFLQCKMINLEVLWKFIKFWNKLKIESQSIPQPGKQTLKIQTRQQKPIEI
jgi:hypothetical protein